MKEFFKLKLTNEADAVKRAINELKYRQTAIEEELKVLDGSPTRETALAGKVKAEKQPNKKPPAKQKKTAAVEKKVEEKEPDNLDLDGYAEYVISEFQEGSTPLLDPALDFMGALSLLDPEAAQPYLDGAKNIGDKLIKLDTELATKEGIKHLPVVVGLIKGRETEPQVHQHKIGPKSQPKIDHYKTRINPKLVDFMLARKATLPEIGKDLAKIFKGLEGAS